MHVTVDEKRTLCGLDVAAVQPGVADPMRNIECHRCLMAMRKLQGLNRAGDWQASIATATSALRLERGEVVLLVGDPGSNLVMVARHAYQALPPFEPGSKEQAEATEIHSLAGLIIPKAVDPDFEEGVPLLVDRPFRAPHHTVSDVGLVGSVRMSGGEKRERVGRRYVTKKTPIVWHPHPGEVSLAHGGVLLLDEVLEFRGSALDAVATALRDGAVVHMRDPQRFEFPARPYAVVMTTTPDQLAKYARRYARILGLVTREVRL